MPKTTIPCSRTPESWELPDGLITGIAAHHGALAIAAANTCDTCPLRAQCLANRPAGPRAYEHRNVQAGEVFEPGIGWLGVESWLALAGLRRCLECQAFHRNEEFCRGGCSRAYFRRLRTQNPNAIICEAPLHNTAWAFQKYNCQHPEARTAYNEQSRRSADRRKARSIATPRTEIAARAQMTADAIAAMADLGMSSEAIAQSVEMHPDSVTRHLRQHAAKQAAKAVA